MQLIENELLKNGYPKRKLKAVIDETKAHGEVAWRTYFQDAYKWIFNIN